MGPPSRAEHGRAEQMGVQRESVYVCSAVYVASQQGLHWETEGRDNFVHLEGVMDKPRCSAMRCDAMRG